ncbi:hypothetical protein AAG570_003372 [Ranatra chinensis]|uniref:Sodium-coupled monocarboxylate transporter 1 n=1 Tax=Ranatra chinensis TaxID=642074 RepID=A0ABD0YS16_9HEMI
MLFISMVIGVYHGFGNKPSTSSHDHFLTAGGRMAAFPVAISMLASFLSSITLLGQPTEIFLYGPQYWLFGLASFLMIPVVGYVLVPVFRQNNSYSAYKYFGDRFNRWLELLASLFFTVHMIVFLALVLYAPALAMEQVTGMSTMVVVTLIYVVCIAYTTIGGIKGVVWTDTFQVVVLFIAMTAILVKGTADIGGFAVVWQRNSMFNRTTLFNWDVDPTQRYTVWSSFIGAGCVHAATYGASQLHVQRYLAVQSLQSARKTLWINAIGWTFIVVITTYSGLLIFAVYFDCDPLTSKKISKADQLFPLYIMDTMATYPGFPGLFMCGILSAGLSTVSTGVNSLAAIWYSEVERTRVGVALTPAQASAAVKSLALAFGLLSYGFVHVVPYMGNLAQVAFSLSSVFTGSLFGLFILGITFPRANSWVNIVDRLLFSSTQPSLLITFLPLAVSATLTRVPHKTENYCTGDIHQ